MSLEFLENDGFKFMAEDEEGALTEERKGSCRKMSMKTQRRINEWLSKKYDQKVEIMGTLFAKKNQAVNEENGEPKKDEEGNQVYDTLWNTLSQDERFEIYARTIKAQNPHLELDDIYSMAFVDADSIVTRMFGIEKDAIEQALQGRDLDFLSESEKANTETGTAENAESSDSAKSETAEA